jgi:asparagine synthase (glutamine-hydrolysing)
MASFFAMVWDTENPEADQYAQDISLRLHRLGRSAHRGASSAGFQLFRDREDPSRDAFVPFTHGDGSSFGAVFGRIFERSETSAAAKPVHAFDAAVSRFIQASMGAAVLERFWGNYVALCKNNRRISIITDPMASIPCFFTIRHQVLLVFSHLEQCGFLDVSDFTLNRNFISLLLCYDKVQTGETGLTEVNELLGGERLIFEDGTARREKLWDPRQIASSPLKIPVRDAAELLAKTTQHAVASWAARYDRIALNLSGGLDSSIVAGCLAACCQSGQLTAIHQVMESADLPETRFAMAAAEHFGIPLAMVTQSAPTVLPDINGHPASARPFRQYLALQNAREAKAEYGTATFTGQGGDHLFLVARMPFIFADHFRLNGLSSETLSALYHAAVLSGKSVWEVLRDSLPGILRRNQMGGMLKAIRARQTPVNSRLSPQAELDAILPEWVTQPAGIPPAKFEQINMLAHLVHMRRPFFVPNQSDVIHPLISQPLIELCLRIPTYQLCADGESRGLARRAFQDALPDVIRHRATKGSAARFYRSNTTGHRAQIAEALLDGELVRQGILERRAIELFFARRDDERHDFGHMALIYYVIEAWLRSWARLVR